MTFSSPFVAMLLLPPDELSLSLSLLVRSAKLSRVSSSGKLHSGSSKVSWSRKLHCGSSKVSISHSMSGDKEWHGSSTSTWSISPSSLSYLYQYYLYSNLLYVIITLTVPGRTLRRRSHRSKTRPVCRPPQDRQH